MTLLVPKWQLISRPMLWFYRNKWIWANSALLSLVSGVALGGLAALFLGVWLGLL